MDSDNRNEGRPMLKRIKVIEMFKLAGIEYGDRPFQWHPVTVRCIKKAVEEKTWGGNTIGDESGTQATGI